MLEEKNTRRLHKRTEFISDISPRNIQPPSKLPPTRGFFARSKEFSSIPVDLMRRSSRESVFNPCLLAYLSKKKQRPLKNGFVSQPLCGCTVRLSSCCQRQRIRPAMRLDCGTAQIQ